jgi:hypothetical protein
MCVMFFLLWSLVFSMRREIDGEVIFQCAARKWLTGRTVVLCSARFFIF